MGFKFTKWQGAGNDFVIVNGFAEKIFDYEKTAIAVCNRNFGIGADGLVIILPSNVADFKMRIFNSDGSEAEMCGNVTRCVARYVYENHLTEKTKISLETKAGIIKPEIIFENGCFSQVKVDMGEPILEGNLIPAIGFGNNKIINEKVKLDQSEYNVTCVYMGNPHCIIFVDDVEKIALETIGPKLEIHNIFPKKINVEFAQVKSNSSIRMRVWERGAGITMACGTGSCATLVASVLNEKTQRQATLELDGGNLFIEWGEDNHVYMSGPAKEVFRGEYLS